MTRINIKPLSENTAFKGQRFKTDMYKSYERHLLYALPKIKLPEPPFELYINFGFSSKLMDIDNPLKPLIDVFQKKLSFNDRDIYKLVVEKEIVKKGEEYFEFEIKTYKSN